MEPGEFHADSPLSDGLLAAMHVRAERSSKYDRKRSATASRVLS
jgi:hypothetical protein